MLSKKKIRMSWLYLLPGLGGTVVFAGLPFLDIIRRSFFSVSTNEFAGFHNYILVIRSRAFQLAVKNNLFFC